MKVLFICNYNINRSRTAEDIFSKKYETKSAGMYNDKPVTREQLEWADVIVVMEDRHKIDLHYRFPKLRMKIFSLDIPDIYAFMDAELVKLLKEKMTVIGL